MRECDYEKVNNFFKEIFGLDLEKNPYLKDNKNSVKNTNNIKTKNDTYAGFKMTNMENDKGILLEYLVPGVNKEDLDICFNDSICCVNAKEKIAFFGELKSKVKINFEIDYKKTKSKLENGILKVFIYKVENETIKNISINIE